MTMHVYTTEIESATCNVWNYLRGLTTTLTLNHLQYSLFYINTVTKIRLEAIKSIHITTYYC